jgi:hypothetical protein
MATKPSTTTLSEHIAQFQTSPIAAQEFCSALTKATIQLHTAGQSSSVFVCGSTVNHAISRILNLIASVGIAHRNIQPEVIVIDGGTVCLCEFADATILDHSSSHDSEAAVAGLALDRHMLACTILYTLAGGRGADGQPLDFDELTKATELGFDDPKLFDHVKAARLELTDLLQAMVDPETPLEELLSRPFYWCRIAASCGSRFVSRLRRTVVFLSSLCAGRELGQWNTSVKKLATRSIPARRQSATNSSTRLSWRSNMQPMCAPVLP